MPQFEVNITYRIEYSAIKYVRAKDEDQARTKVELALQDGITSANDFQTYIGKDSEVVQDETIEIDSVNEA